MQTSTLRIVRVAGSPRERGRQHGEELRSLIHENLARWKDSLGIATGVPTDRYLDRFLSATEFLDSLRQWTPHLLEEVQGIGEGAGIPFRDVYAFQIVDEEWLYRSSFTPGQLEEHCSALGIYNRIDGPPIVAQNMDIPAYYDGTQTLLVVSGPDMEVEAAVLTPAGLIATTGCNNRGIAICCNSVPQLNHSSRGLPVAFVVRHVLDHPSHEDAVQFVRAVPHASPQNYTIGGPERVVDLEVSSNLVVELTWIEGRVCHTNHPLVNQDLKPGYDTSLIGSPMEEIAGRVDRQGAPGSTSGRLSFLQDALGTPDQDVKVKDVQELLSAEEPGVSRSRRDATSGMTFGSIVMELSVPPVVRLAPGPPHCTPFETWKF